MGINEPVRIYEILEINNEAAQALHDKVSLFHKALDIFESRDWSKAETAFKMVLELSPDDRPTLLFLDRCRQYLQYSPPKDWDGVVNFTEK